METQIKKPFGIMPDGREVFSYSLSNGNGAEFTVMDYGATITSLKVPLANGETADVVLGFDTLQDYLESINLPAPPHFGAAIGRWAGRINQGFFTLNGKEYQLNQNNGGHSLHGGRYGFSQIVWDVERINSEDDPSITFKYFSRHGDENFPGDLNVYVTYTLSEDNALIVDFWAEAQDDTIVNLT
ncbi:MAG TPA: galactose mutarotase, partial [Flavobacterium sp.]